MEQDDPATASPRVLATGRVARLVERGLIVSCQAREGEALRSPTIQAAMAEAAVSGGACAIRANGPADIAAIKGRVTVPVFGILKRNYDGSPVYITPTIAEARAVAAAGSDVVTVDATAQARPDGLRLAGFYDQLSALQLPLMADVSTADEGRLAADLGFDFVATTLAGYTKYSRQLDGPDLRLVEELAMATSVPVIAEGRIATPQQARQALDAGAWAVVVGSMITRPGHITAYFVSGMRAEPSR